MNSVMDWVLKIMGGGLVPVGSRTQFLGAATALGAVLAAVVQWLVGDPSMGLMDLWHLVADKWEAILAGAVVFTGGAKVEAMKQALMGK